MPKVALKLDELSDANILQLATTLHDGVSANAASFPAIAPTVVQVQAAIDAAQAALTAQQMKEQEALAATMAKKDAFSALKGTLRGFAMSAELVTGGNAMTLADAGFPMAAAPQPIGELPKVENLAATFGDNPGELDLTWEPVAGKKSYEIWTNPTPNNAAGWTFKVSVGKSSATVSGLPTGQVCHLKVRAVGGSTGYGPFSDIVEHLIP